MFCYAGIRLGHVAERLGAGLQNLLRRFESVHDLNSDALLLGYYQLVLYGHAARSYLMVMRRGCAAYGVFVVFLNDRNEEFITTDPSGVDKCVRVCTCAGCW